MKSLILLSVFTSFVVANNSFANDRTKPTIATRDIAIKSSFRKIIVEKNFKVILFQNPGKSSIKVMGDGKNIQYVDASVSNDQLIISSPKKLNCKNITVYIPVKNLSSLQLASGASVSGEGTLSFDDLKVSLDADSYVDLKSFGSISLLPVNDCEVVYVNNEISKVIYVTQ